MRNRLGELSSTLRYNKKVHVHILRCVKCAAESKSFFGDNWRSEANMGNGE